MNNYGFVVTTAGLDLMAEMFAGESLVLTRVMVGSGKVLEIVNPADFVDLIEPVALASSTTPVIEDNTMSLVVEYRNDMNGGLQEGFNLNEFGIFAKRTSGDEVLLGYGTLGDYPQPVVPISIGGVDTKRFPVSIVLSNELEVTAGYPTIAFMTAEDVDDAINSHSLSPAAHPDKLPLVVVPAPGTPWNPAILPYTDARYVTGMGIAKITLPDGYVNNSGVRLRILSRINSNVFGAAEMQIDGVVGNANVWSYMSAASRNFQFDTVRFGHDGNNHCILIGDVDSSWGNSIIVLAEILTFSNEGIRDSRDIKIERIPDFTGITLSGSPIRANDRLYAAKTLYVDPAGDDILGSGTQANPFATIQAAVDSLPKNLNGFDPTINVAAGTYTTSVIASGFFGGKLATSINGAVVFNVTSGLALFGTYDGAQNHLNLASGSALTLNCNNLAGIYTYDNGSFSVTGVGTPTIIINNPSNGLYANRLGNIAINGVNVQINNAASNGVCVTNGNISSVNEVSGSGNNTAIYAAAGIIQINNPTITGSTKVIKASGGQALTGAGVDIV